MSAGALLDGRSVAGEIRAEVAAAVTALVGDGGRPPGLAAVLVGDDPASRVYVRSKRRAAEEAGFVSEVLELPASVGLAELTAELQRLNERPGIDGLLVQLPLPEHLPEDEVLAAVRPERDVDGIHPLNVGRLWLDREGIAPATPSGIIELLRRSGVPLAGRRAVIVGRSKLVGKPLAALLLREQCTVTLCHSRTRELDAVCREAELLVAAVGRPALIGPDHVRPGAVVVDVGTNRITDPDMVAHLFPGDEKRRARLERKGSILVGDVDFTRVRPLASAISPVPGGVGPLTVAMLLVNTLAASRRRQLGAGDSS